MPFARPRSRSEPWRARRAARHRPPPVRSAQPAAAYTRSRPTRMPEVRISRARVQGAGQTPLCRCEQAVPLLRRIWSSEASRVILSPDGGLGLLVQPIQMAAEGVAQPGEDIARSEE